MSMDTSDIRPGDELPGYLLRLLGQLAGLVLALSAFAIWLLPGAGDGLSLARLALSLALLLTGMGSVLACGGRR